MFLRGPERYSLSMHWIWSRSQRGAREAQTQPDLARA